MNLAPIISPLIMIALSEISEMVSKHSARADLNWLHRLLLAKAGHLQPWEWQLGCEAREIFAKPSQEQECFFWCQQCIVLQKIV